MADRARAFAQRIADDWRVTVACRSGSRLADTLAFARRLDRERPDVVYVFDMALAGVLAASWDRTRRPARLIIDTGDAITALARSLRGPIGVAATSAVERLALSRADHIVVRGSFHQEWLLKQGFASTVVPDGVDLHTFRADDGRAGRRRLGIGDELTIGVLGSCEWSAALQITYGWDLIELLALLREQQVRGVIIGDGSGIAHLQKRARELALEDRVVFAGRRSMSELPGLLSACDICLSTQTNDLAGNVRTTGKLPLYLACGRYILASRVGEAARVLPAEMLVPYEGTVDREYPARLAKRVRLLYDDRPKLELARTGPEIARRHFDYDRLSLRVSTVLAARAHRNDPGGANASHGREQAD